MCKAFDCIASCFVVTHYLLSDKLVKEGLLQFDDATFQVVILFDGAFLFN